MPLNATATPIFVSLNTTEPAGGPAKTAAQKHPEPTQADKDTLPKYQTSRSAKHRVLNQVPNAENQENKRQVGSPEWLSSIEAQASAEFTQYPTPTDLGIPSWLSPYISQPTAGSQPPAVSQPPAAPTEYPGSTGTLTTLATTTSTSTSVSTLPPSETQLSGAGRAIDGAGNAALAALGLYLAKRIILGR
jgi:hypothetical protein